jgi:hypothetical protein
VEGWRGPLHSFAKAITGWLVLLLSSERVTTKRTMLLQYAMRPQEILHNTYLWLSLGRVRSARDKGL